MCDKEDRKRRRFLTVKQAADELNRDERSVWRAIEEGDLVSHKFGGSTRINRRDLDDYIERNRRKRLGKTETPPKKPPPKSDDEEPHQKHRIVSRADVGR